MYVYRTVTTHVVLPVMSFIKKDFSRTLIFIYLVTRFLGSEKKQVRKEQEDFRKGSRELCPVSITYSYDKGNGKKQINI